MSIQDGEESEFIVARSLVVLLMVINWFGGSVAILAALLTVEYTRGGSLQWGIAVLLGMFATHVLLSALSGFFRLVNNLQTMSDSASPQYLVNYCREMKADLKRLADRLEDSERSKKD